MGDYRPSPVRSSKLNSRKSSKESILIQKSKAKTRISSPENYSKVSPSNNKSSNSNVSIQGQVLDSKFLEPKYRELLAKYLAASSRQNSPQDSHFTSRGKIEKKVVHRKSASNNGSPLVPRLSIDQHKVNEILSSNYSQDRTLRNETKRHSSVDAKALHSSSAKSIGGLMDTCRKEQEESKREKLLSTLLTSIRSGSILMTSSSYYMIGKQLGKGAFGKVYLGLHRLTGLKVAIKTIDKSIIEDERTRRKVFQEVYVMKRVNHQNIIRLLEVFESSKHLMIVLEYSGGGDLLQLVKSRSNLTETEGKNIFSQVVDAVKACHSKNIIHRDIKLDNILITTDFMCVKLCDFGVSRTVKPGEKIYDQCGTPAYLAPEIVADRGYDPFFVDIWSMGVLLYAILSGTVPFRAKTLQELHKLILRCKYQMPGNISEQAQDLIRRMLNPVPHLRISLDEMKQHPWFEHFLGESVVEDSIAPRFLGNFWASIRRNSEKEIIAKMNEMGFANDYVQAALRNKEINHVTATYYLLEISGV